jgi:dTMP kinase
VAASSGVLVSLEGGEGSGKTSQCRLLLAWLAEIGVPAAAVREPGGTAIGERLRALLLDPALPPLVPEGEVLLFAAARAQAVSEVIRPALARGQLVICDRFVDSSLAYQGFGLGADLGFIRSVNVAVTGGLTPQLTVLLDVPPELGAARRAGRNGGDRVEARGPAFHAAVRAGYLRLAREEPGRFVVLDGTGPLEVVHAAVRSSVARVLDLGGSGGANRAAER